MKIEVILPLYNGAETLNQLSESLKKQSGIEFELTVVDSSSTDNGIEVIQNHFPNASIHIINKKEFNHAGTRNKYAMKSNADVVVFITQDIIFKNENALLELIKPFNDEAVAVTYARQIAHLNASFLEQEVREFNYPKEDRIQSSSSINELGIKTYFCSNSCAAYRMSTFKNIGGFCESLILSEDMYYAYQVIENYDNSVFYASNAKIHHSHDYNFINQLKRNFDIGVFMKEHKYIFEKVNTDKEGALLVIKLVKESLKNKKYKETIKVITDSIARLIGNKLGKNHSLFPKSIIKKISMHNFYFDKIGE